MTFTDFLSRKSRQIPLSWNHTGFIWLTWSATEKKYYIHTRSGAKKAGINVGKVHGHDKPLLPHMK